MDSIVTQRIKKENIMIDDVKKSIQLILAERISSPLSGAVMFSWFVWNWKILYYLFSDDMSLKLTDRLQFIETNYLDIYHLIVFPVLSAILLVTVYPYATTLALKIWLSHKKRQTDIKNEIEMKQLLTLEQSIELRKSIQKQEEEFKKVIDAKVNEISLLNSQIGEFGRMKDSYELLTARNNKTNEEHESIKKENQDLSKYISVIETNMKESPAYKELENELRRALENERVIGMQANNLKREREDFIKQIGELRLDYGQLKEKLLKIQNESSSPKIPKELQTILSNQELRKYFEKVLDGIQENDYLLSNAIPAVALQYFVSSDIVEERGGMVILTPKGIEFAKEYALRAFEKTIK